MSDETLPIQVVVPAYQAERTLPACLDGLAAAGFAAAEIIVVDDNSQDGTAAIAMARGIRVIRPAAGRGAAGARNTGVTAASADIICFVDADVVLHAGMADRLRAHFAADPGLDAVFGSYDDAPPVRHAVSFYRNLLHHHVHQNGDERATTFWTGFGAMRRARFQALGGFDPSTENIEDVDLGMRLTAAGGRIRLDKGLMCTHLKHWTLRDMLRTDLYGRAVPWMRLIVSREGLRNDLNTGWTHRLNAGLSVLIVLALLLAPFTVAVMAISVLALLTFVALNQGFFGLVWRKGGPATALAAVPLHIAHYLAAIAGALHVTVFEGGRALLARRRVAPQDR